jgi:hypothetical protein
MSAVAILSELERREVSVTADGDALVLKPRRALDDALLARVREHKPEIMRALTAHPATCATSCYEIDPGRWIHHPWDGCKTCPKPLTERRKTETVCWHCTGERHCACSACWTAGPRECVACKGTGKIQVRVQ